MMRSHPIVPLRRFLVSFGWLVTLAVALPLSAEQPPDGGTDQPAAAITSPGPRTVGGAQTEQDTSETRVSDKPAADEMSGNWSQWRGPNRDGHFSGPAWPDALAGRMELMWEMPLGPSYSGPVSDGKLVFTTETVDRTFERVTAFELATGKLAWTAQWEGSLAVPFFAAANGDWIRSTPALVPGHLVVAGMRDVIVCLDPATGQQRWRVDMAADHGNSLQAFGCVCSPLIDGDAVYLQTGGGVTKLSLADGSLVWQTLNEGAGMMDGGAFSSPIVATLDGQRQLVVATRTRLIGVSLADGRELWGEPIESFRGMNILTPVVADGRLFSSAHSGRSRLFAVAAKDGSVPAVTELWDNKSQAYMSSPVVIGDHLYLHLKNQRFVCMDLRDGTEKWTTPPFGKYWSMIANPQGGTMLALDEDGQLRLIAADPGSYRQLSEAKVADDSWAHLAIQPLSDLATADSAPQAILVRAIDRLRVYRWE